MSGAWGGDWKNRRSIAAEAANDRAMRTPAKIKDYDTLESLETRRDELSILVSGGTMDADLLREFLTVLNKIEFIKRGGV